MRAELPGTSAAAGRPDTPEAGYAMAALIVAIAVMMVGLGVAAPSWRYVVKNMKEEELIFRGTQIADAIQRFQAKNGNAVPPNLEVLVKGKYLRLAYADPMSEDGEWRYIRLGESLGPVGTPGGPQRPPGAGAAPRQRGGATSGATLGGIVGVASKSTDDGLRVFNGRTKYSEWIFAPGQPRVVGAIPVGPPPPGVQGQPPGAGPAQKQGQGSRGRTQAPPPRRQ